MIASKMRSWLWHRLIHLADRIEPDQSFRCMNMTFTFERGVGIVFHEGGERGCMMWYRTPDYYRAHREASNPL